MKVCKSCGIEKPLSKYHLAQKAGYVGKDGYTRTTDVYKAHCKECYKKQQLEKYHELPIETKRHRRRKRDPEYHKAYKLKTLYGLTTEQFSAMIVEQNSVCKICSCHLDKPQIDHCHTTGKVRGLLCRSCNTSLGLLKENTNTLHSMIQYINDNL